MQEETQSVTYRFALENGDEYASTITFGMLLPSVVPDAGLKDLPDWTRLDFHTCKGCTLKGSDRCPVAVRLIEPLHIMGKIFSYERVKVTVETPRRTIVFEADAQQGLSSYFGLVMATSGCPSLEVFRAMAWFHLPSASYEETLFRVVAFQLMKHYQDGTLQNNKQQLADGIRAIYRSISHVNIGLIERLRNAAIMRADSPFNAVIILDALASMIPESVESGMPEFEGLFTHQA